MCDFESMEDSYFGCACHNRDHIIIARHFVWGEKKDGKLRIIDNDIYFNFVCNYHCIPKWNHFYRLQDFVWRIKQAIKILFTGKIRIEGEWIPESFEEDRKDRLNGLKELKRFVKWLQGAIKKSENNYNKIKEIN